MNFAIYNLATGQIRCSVQCTQEQAGMSCGPGEFFIPSEVNDSTHYVVDGVPVPFPARPSEFHHWDWSSLVFVGDVEAARAAKAEALKNERDAREVAPVIVYDGKNLDADAISLDRLTKKLATTKIQIDRGIAPPVQTLVWRDADNITHSFTDLASYRDWLAGFALALDSRGMEAFAWYWQKEVELEGLTTIDQVMAFVIE